MGVIGRVLGFEFVTKSGGINYPALTVEDRAGDNRVVEYFQSSGEDSPPLPNDNVALIDVQRQGGKSAVGVMDNKNTGVAVPGEKRIYARNTNGAVVAEFHLKGDGSFSLTDKAGNYSFSINAAGDAALVCTSFEITTPTLTNNGTNIGDSHNHSQANDSNGDTEADTSGPQ